jgi:hypothetical protein
MQWVMQVGVRIARKEASSISSIEMYRDAVSRSLERVGDIVLLIQCIANVISKKCLGLGIPLIGND